MKNGEEFDVLNSPDNWIYRLKMEDDKLTIYRCEDDYEQIIEDTNKWVKITDTKIISELLAHVVKLTVEIRYDYPLFMSGNF